MEQLETFQNEFDSYYEKQESYNQTEENRKLIAMSAEDFDRFMCERFPGLFAQRNLSEQETCMCWGFEIGKGWYPLLFELCEKLEVLCKVGNIDFQFTQIKEKYGSGRFYYSTQIKEPAALPEQQILVSVISDLVSEYEDKADHICAISGKYYKHKIDIGWVYDMCLEEFEKAFAKYPERVEKARNCVERQKTIDKIKELLYYSPIEKLNQIKEQCRKE